LLIGSITIAVVVLTSVVLLNSIHSSPNITADSQAEALDSVEGLDGEIQQNVQRLFLNTNSDNEQLPYALKGPFRSQIVPTYEETYNRFTAIDGSRVISIEQTDFTEGAVAYNRSVNTSKADKYDDRVLLRFVNSSADTQIPRISINATELDDERIDFEFDPPVPPISQDRGIRIDPGDDEVVLGNYNSGDRKVCSFGELEQVTIELTSGVGIVENETSGCAVGPEDSPLQTSGSPLPVGGDIDEVTLGFDEDSFDDDNDDTTFSFEISAATTQPDGCDGTTVYLECVDGENTPGPIVNGEFDVEIRDPSVTYSSSFKLFPGIVESDDSILGIGGI
jgi:hypothetical protein